MYNLLVTATEGAWEEGFYEYDKSRFLEYTNEDIASALKGLNESHIENLKSYPCLFAYEGEDSDVRIGYLTSIKERGRNILIEFEFQQNIDPIPFEKIQPIAPLLDIRGWEMSRTHWAVKDEDLFARLRTRGILEPSRVSKTANKKDQRRIKRQILKLVKSKALLGKY